MKDFEIIRKTRKTEKLNDYFFVVNIYYYICLSTVPQIHFSKLQEKKLKIRSILIKFELSWIERDRGIILIECIVIDD